MDRYVALFEMARLLIAEEDAAGTVDALFSRILELTEAHRGCLVVREGEEFVRRLDFHFEQRVNQEERRFSRSLVRKAIEEKQVVHSDNLLDDPRFAANKSVLQLGPCAALVVPLLHEGVVFGAVYLDRLGNTGGFQADAVALMRDLGELAGSVLRRAVDREARQQRHALLEAELFGRYDFEGIVTQDPVMLALLRMVAQVADSDATALIGGETGTGKELIARALHANSKRRHKPFVVLHCTALPATILESELFGHVRGAFTGAERDRAGRVASAHGGTLFLDEVAEIAPEVQAKLLRFLQFGEVQRLGADRTDKVDVRVVCATHQNLAELVKQGRFRQDLFFRIKVIEIDLPPLRERRGDIELLVDTFLEAAWKKRAAPPRLSARARSLLAAHDWPGNVRELAHVVERMVVLGGDHGELGEDLLPEELRHAGGGGEQRADTRPPAAVSSMPPAAHTDRLTSEELERVREEAISQAERAFLQALSDRCAGNISAAARESGIHRSYLQRLLTKHGLRSG
ncbi:MAG: sigma 54-interacting transcriptional regulator [Polyangiaceae bacterium]